MCLDTTCTCYIYILLIYNMYKSHTYITHVHNTYTCTFLPVDHDMRGKWVKGGKAGWQQATLLTSKPATPDYKSCAEDDQIR